MEVLLLICTLFLIVVLVSQVCPTLCDPMNCSPPGSSVHGILQAGILEWLPCPPPGDLPDSGIKPRSPALQVDSLPFEPLGNSIFIKKKIIFCLSYVTNISVCLFHVFFLFKSFFFFYTAVLLCK